MAKNGVKYAYMLSKIYHSRSALVTNSLQKKTKMTITNETKP